MSDKNRTDLPYNMDDDGYEFGIHEGLRTSFLELLRIRNLYIMHWQGMRHELFILDRPYPKYGGPFPPEGLVCPPFVGRNKTEVLMQGMVWLLAHNELVPQKKPAGKIAAPSDVARWDVSLPPAT